MKRLVITALVVVVASLGLRLLRRPQPDASGPAQLDTRSLAETSTASRATRNNDQFTSLPEQAVKNTGPTNWLARKIAGDLPKLTAEQAEVYVAVNKRSAESLLAAYRSTGDKAFIREALEKFPDDSKVNLTGYFDALFHNKDDYSTEERRAMLERFARSAPENSLADYLAASDYFRSGQTGKALEQSRNAATKSALNDYSLEFMQNAEEAYRSAGYSEADAKAIATLTLSFPHLSELKHTGVELRQLVGRYQQSGDLESARVAQQLMLHLADLLQDRSQQKIIINQLVGMAIERLVLGSLDFNSAYDESGRTVQNRIDELSQVRKDLSATVGAWETLLPVMPPADQAAFFDRLRIYGEVAAMKWAVEKYRD